MGRKIWVMANREVVALFRDVGALVMALVTPLLLTLIVGAAFAGDTGPTHIPVLLLDRDGSVFSEALVESFSDPALGDLLEPELVTDEAAARARVEADEVAALVIIPPGYGDALFPQRKTVLETLGIDLTQPSTPDVIGALSLAEKLQLMALIRQQPAAPPLELLIYASPDRPVSTLIIKSLTQRAIEIANLRTQGTRVMLEELYALAPGSKWEGAETRLAESAAQEVDTAELPVRLEAVMPSGRPFRWLDYIAGSMAVLFLMFTVTAGGRTLLAERERGTLSRLLLTPTPAGVILVGKLSGTMLTGLVQMLLLWGATSLAGAWWGPPPLVLVCIVVLVICSTGVGALIAAWARTSVQAGSIGAAFSLIGAALAGSFLPREGLPAFVRSISLVTPHAWGIELFTALHLGAGLAELLPTLSGALLLGLVYYGLAVLGFRRQFA